MRPAVFLDRDDTLIVNRAITRDTLYPGSLFDPTLVRLCPGAAEACRRLSSAGYALVVVSNQGCVSRGECTTSQVDATNERTRELVSEQSGVDLDGMYYCPYHPKGTVPPYNVEHAWRKPQPGMILAAAEELGLDLGKSWMIGDAERDITAAVRAGIAPERTIVVGPTRVGGAGHLAADMMRAAEVILGGRDPARTSPRRAAGEKY